MTEQAILDYLRTLNSSEIFYRNYRLAKSSPIGFEEFLAHIDKEQVSRDNLLVPEWPQTIPPEYLEDWYFSPDERDSSITATRLPCPTTTTSSRCFTYWKATRPTGLAKTAPC